jgi:hypothetical protein
MSLAYSEDNNKKNFFGLMDNARGYELHLKQLEGIYKKNNIRQVESSNMLNNRILRTRVVNCKFVRDHEQKVIRQENEKFLTKLGTVDGRKCKYPKYNYLMPTGIPKMTYESRIKTDTSEKSVKSRRSGPSVKSAESIRSMHTAKLSQNSKASKGSQNSKNPFSNYDPVNKGPKLKSKPQTSIGGSRPRNDPYGGPHRTQELARSRSSSGVRGDRRSI